MDELRECPFCGQELFAGMNIHKKPVVRHGCNSDCPLSEALWRDTPGFRERWNARHSPKPEALTGWISVEDGLPEDDKTLLFHRETHMEMTSVIACGYLCVESKNLSVRLVNRLIFKPTGIECVDKAANVLDEWHWSYAFWKVTHWMPLPELPREG